MVLREKVLVADASWNVWQAWSFDLGLKLRTRFFEWRSLGAGFVMNRKRKVAAEGWEWHLEGQKRQILTVSRYSSLPEAACVRALGVSSGYGKWSSEEIKREGSSCMCCLC